MNRSKFTVIDFDYGGYYSGGQWIVGEDPNYTLLMKESLEELTFCGLVSRICKKINVDEDTTKLKLTYIPFRADQNKASIILDDEDVIAYVMRYKDDCASVLHVELLEGVSQNKNFEKRSREDRGSGVDVWNEEIVSDGRANDCMMISRNTESEPTEQLLLDNAPHDADCENDQHEEVAYDVEVTPNAQANEVVHHEWDDGIDMTLGQEFESKRAVQDLVERAVHLNCFEVATVKSTTVLYVLKCRDGACKWSLRVAKYKNSDRWSVRTYKKKHTCSRITTSTSTQFSRKGTPGLVASVVHQFYPGQFNTPKPKSLVGLVQRELGVNVSVTTAWRGRHKAINDLRGSPDESFTRLPSYLHMLEEKNHGTVTYVECDEEKRFKYLFIALGACIEGFRAMRKVIILDGTHLSSKHRGVLIVVMAQDPDRHHYPLAFGVVDSENNASWSWFLNKLKTVVPEDPEIVFVSDRNQSIIRMIGEVYPQCKHGYCIQHLSQNVQSHVYGVNKEEVTAKFREMAQVYTVGEFTPLYDSFRKRYPKAVEYLEESTSENKWARCYFPGERYNIDSTNCVESMNNVLREARQYALLPMLDAIVGKIAEWFNKYRKLSSEVPVTEMLVPRVAKELHQRCQDAKLLPVTELNSFTLVYTVLGRDGRNYLVDLTNKTCSCKHFDIDRYPCVHAIAAATTYAKSGKPLELHELCSVYYLMEQWSLAYHRTIYPVPHMSEWNVPEEVKASCVIPPPYTKTKGRNRVNRYPSVGEPRRRRKRGGVIHGLFGDNPGTST